MITVGEAARRLGVSRQRIMELFDRGAIAGQRTPAGRQIDAPSLVTWAAEHEDRRKRYRGLLPADALTRQGRSMRRKRHSITPEEKKGEERMVTRTNERAPTLGPWFLDDDYLVAGDSPETEVRIAKATVTD